MRVRGRPAVVFSLPCLFAQLGVQAARTPLQIRPKLRANETETTHTFIFDRDAGLLSASAPLAALDLNIWTHVSVNLEPIPLLLFF